MLKRQHCFEHGGLKFLLSIFMTGLTVPVQMFFKLKYWNQAGRLPMF